MYMRFRIVVPVVFVSRKFLVEIYDTYQRKNYYSLWHAICLA